MIARMFCWRIISEATMGAPGPGGCHGPVRYESRARGPGRRRLSFGACLWMAASRWPSCPSKALAIELTGPPKPPDLLSDTVMHAAGRAGRPARLLIGVPLAGDGRRLTMNSEGFWPKEAAISADLAAVYGLHRS